MVSKLEPRGSSGSARWQALRSHRDLAAYQRSLDLQVRVHEVCRRLPRDERHDLASHMRRASKSIPANIAEGFTRKKSEREFKQYMKMAMASAHEMESHLGAAGRLGYLKAKELAALSEGYDHVGQQLNRLIAIWGHF